MISPIESAEDLAKQNVIQYGTLLGGSTMTFFEVSESIGVNSYWAQGLKPPPLL